MEFMPQKNQLLYSWFSTNFVDIDRFMNLSSQKSTKLIKAIREKTENQVFAEFKYHKKPTIGYMVHLDIF